MFFDLNPLVRAVAGVAGVSFLSCAASELVDLTLLRLGHFDSQVTVDWPDVAGSVKILQFLYPSEEDMYKLIRFLVGRLSDSSQTAVSPETKVTNAIATINIGNLDADGEGQDLHTKVEDLKLRTDEALDIVHCFIIFQLQVSRERNNSTVMVDEKSPISRDRELLIPVANTVTDDNTSSSKPSPSSTSSSHNSGRETFYKVIRSWASKKFMTGCVILLPMAITFYVTWWFIHFVDGFFSPIYVQLGIDIFGVGFITSLMFIFLVGVFMSSWLGASVLSLGEWFIKRMPFVRHIYNASKQISAAISPDQNTQAFKEVAIIRHPRIGEYAFGFITSSVILQNYSGDEELYSVFVPTNHLYIGDIFLVNSKDVIRPNLSVREGIEIVVSGGMSMPQILSTLDSNVNGDRPRNNRS
ncbi:hypothetical protein QVD17_27690 [Tagetes erecta]|uniref:Uncharacterized protein n=1 Tax=Tagetes erecta TaxID=13708 RepID=A0AAD8NJQ8_TARER|nr:hypothetical protein QVD17_27690 [Tagetes erecta]